MYAKMVLSFSMVLDLIHSDVGAFRALVKVMLGNQLRMVFSNLNRNLRDLKDEISYQEVALHHARAEVERARAEIDVWRPDGCMHPDTHNRYWHLWDTVNDNEVRSQEAMVDLMSLRAQVAELSAAVAFVYNEIERRKL